MKIRKDYQLQGLNTLRLPSVTSRFATISQPSDILELLNAIDPETLFMLGGGSNVLFAGDYEGTVAHMRIKGIDLIEETDSDVIVQVGAGEDWHTFVTYVVSKNWGGIENMALIPGTVGAAAVQNIAAYGQNIVDVFDSVDAIEVSTGLIKTFTRQECELEYRTSIFKTTLKGKYLITQVRLRLHKNHQLNTDYFMMHVSYDSLQGELKTFAQKPYTIHDVYQAVINIRTRKLPDPDKFPTCGSFFLNPVVSITKLEELQSKMNELQFYPLEQLSYSSPAGLDLKQQEYVKLPAGRLIDELGWRGKTIGNCKVWDKHALIFTHNGKATGKEFLAFTQTINRSVFEEFGVKLESEVVVVG
ncbi:UDP-N-acetylmuramate dehydrogenase [bacterium]|nr:UDP-N-acetylmuramate dehydrogenase [bacterium]